jgi:IS1 family transposase
MNSTNTYILGYQNWQLEKQIRDAWRYYKVRSNDCHAIANRVKNRQIIGIAYGYALPGETDLYDKYARELRETEEYIAVRQKEINRKNPKLRQDNYAFNQAQIERLRNELRA